MRSYVPRLSGSRGNSHCFVRLSGTAERYAVMGLKLLISLAHFYIFKSPTQCFQCPVNVSVRVCGHRGQTKPGSVHLHCGVDDGDNEKPCLAAASRQSKCLLLCRA